MKASELEEMNREVVRSRDSRRPDMESVVRVMDESVEYMNSTGRVNLVAVERGPDRWRWIDTKLLPSGFVHEYVVAGSADAEVPGYPCLTIRQMIAPKLDAQLSYQTLILGPEDGHIAYSIAVAVASQHGAFTGLKDEITKVVAGNSESDAEEVVASAMRAVRGELN